MCALKINTDPKNWREVCEVVVVVLLLVLLLV
jgi:hypothetical protein